MEFQFLKIFIFIDFIEIFEIIELIRMYVFLWMIPKCIFRYDSNRSHPIRYTAESSIVAANVSLTNTGKKVF